jgi:hypothetical protein
MLVRINFKLGFYIHGDGESFVEGERGLAINIIYYDR